MAGNFSTILETFLVEWKHGLSCLSRVGIFPLETFLVEWKPTAPESADMAERALETFLVEWKQIQRQIYGEPTEPLKPS